ncbi:MAG TPA: protease pro-enzyme activation domain-containing protein [Verrucomicrobiae bacterium]|nr:protease pro-enzyme activation domain-containing protein [Verrucomicrobiae bacterium]
MSRMTIWGISFAGILAAVLSCGAPAFAQSDALSRRLVTQSINERSLVTLSGNTRPEVTPANDRGPVADDLQMNHMYMLLNRTPEQTQAAANLVNELHDANSPMYHQWLTPDEIAARFGPSEGDVQAVSDWLESHGFTVNTVYPSDGVIDFSGSAGSIREAFHTEIHNLSVKGQHHIANVSDPKIPAALAPAIQGIVSMNDFRPHPAMKPRSAYTINAIYQALVPGDLETIYNINPLYAHGVSGQGQTVVVVEDTDLYTTADWYTFRKTFGLAQKFPQGSLSQIHPQPSRGFFSGGPCADPGVNGDDSEAAVDVEWASAAAPSAAIVLASCADTNANFGGFIALQNLLTGRGLAPAIVSISYLESESYLGSSSNAYINQLYQLAVLEGVSVFTAAGDAGADTSDQFSIAAVSGLNVSGFASTAYDVAVGGTDFGDAFLGSTASYWSATNGPYYNSALSYIPEIPWNDSCASQLITLVLGFSQSYGPTGSCNSTIGEEFLGVIGGSGGPSSCAYGNPTISGVVGGSCAGYPKPFFQQVYGNPRDRVRDVPDVSLFAGNGVWGHYYVICYTDPTPGYYGAPCVVPPAGTPADWSGGGGTSFAAPILAGIQAIINQTSEPRQGNPDYVYYQLASEEYGYKGDSSCNSTLGNQTSAGCVFYDLTLGDDDVNCLPLVANGVTLGSFNCYYDGATNGVLSTSTHSYKPAYVTAPGYDYPSGIGSVNAFNLARSWPGSRLRNAR